MKPEEAFEDLVETILSPRIPGVSKFTQERWLQMARASALERYNLDKDAVEAIIERVRARLKIPDA